MLANNVKKNRMHYLQEVDADLKLLLVLFSISREQKYITESLSFREDKFAYQNYPSQQISGYGEEIYINFTKRTDIDEQYIYATGDGGESWHCVYSGSVGDGIPNLGNPSGVTADGKIAFSLREYGEGLLSYPLVYSNAIEWVTL